MTLRKVQSSRLPQAEGHMASGARGGQASLRQGPGLVCPGQPPRAWPWGRSWRLRAGVCPPAGAAGPLSAVPIVKQNRTGTEGRSLRTSLVPAPQLCGYLCPDGRSDLGRSRSGPLLSLPGLAWPDCHGGAGGGGHLAWDVLADRWLSGGRTDRAGTDLRMAGCWALRSSQEPHRPGRTAEGGTGSLSSLLPWYGPRRSPWGICRQQKSQRPSHDAGPGPQGRRGPCTWTAACKLLCRTPRSRWPAMTIPVASSGRCLWLGLIQSNSGLMMHEEGTVAQGLLCLGLGALPPPAWCHLELDALPKDFSQPHPDVEITAAPATQHPRWTSARLLGPAGHKCR